MAKLVSHIVERKARTATAALASLDPDTAVHGLTNGRWSMIDALRALLLRFGPCRLWMSTWTASAADLTAAERLLRSGQITDFRLLVDRSFLGRQPRYCAAARQLFGDDAIRVWRSHAKFALVGPVLYVTSANLNANKRIESYSAFRDEGLADEYAAMVDLAFARQKAGEGFDDPKAANRLYRSLFR